MTLTTPWALLGLVALPLIWWLQKRLRRPPDVELPSLMFLLDEAEARALPRGRLFDAELLLALAAAALIAVAAAEPVLARAAPRTIVRVVVSGGGGASRMEYLRAVEATLAEVRAASGDDTEVDVTWLPAHPGDGFYLRRPTDDALLASVQAGAASRRIVISDRRGPVDTLAATWVTLGAARANNTGIVAAAVHEDAGVSELFLTLLHQGPAPVSGRVVVSPRVLVLAGGQAAFSLAADAYASVRIPLGALEGADLRVRLERTDGELWDDDLAYDDDIELTHGPLGVWVDRALPAPLTARIRHALTAALGQAGYVDSDWPALSFLATAGAARGGPVRLLLQPTAEGESVRTAPAGVDRRVPGRLVADLGTVGTGWAYGPGADAVRTGEHILLARVAGERVWPVLLRHGLWVRLAPDPMRGVPRPVDTPFWPMLVENLAREAGDATVGGGYRATGLLDAASSRVGTARVPLDPARLAALPPARPGRVRSLRPPLVLGALLCLALLWSLPRLRRRFARRRALRANPHVRTAPSEA